MMLPAILPAYAELHALSNFSFQRGASHAEELVERAAALGYSAIAMTDECSVAGVVRAHGEAQKHGLQLLPGAEFLVQCDSPFRLVVLPHNATGWGNLCEFITQAKADGDVLEKGSYLVTPASGLSMLQHCEVIFCLPQGAINTEAARARIDWARGLFNTQLWLAAELLQGMDDALRLQQLQDLSCQTGVPPAARNQGSGTRPS